jgi:hypothetical protein
MQFVQAVNHCKRVWTMCMLSNPAAMNFIMVSQKASYLGSQLTTCFENGFILHASMKY